MKYPKWLSKNGTIGVTAPSNGVIGEKLCGYKKAVKKVSNNDCNNLWIQHQCFWHEKMA